MKNPHQHVLLYSGGLDSYIAYHYLEAQGYAVIPLYAQLGHRYETQEYMALKRTQPFLNAEIQLDNRVLLGDVEEANANIPMRNSFLAHIGALYGGNIWLTIQKGEMNIPDRSPEFLTQLSSLLSHLQGHTIRVRTPFSHMTKTDMVSWYLEQNLPLDGLLATHSCYSPVGTQPCGKCGACFRRFVSMSLNGIEEKYISDPWTTKLAKEYLEKGETGFYGEARDKNILEALRRKGVYNEL